MFCMVYKQQVKDFMDFTESQGTNLWKHWIRASLPQLHLEAEVFGVTVTQPIGDSGDNLEQNAQW